MYKMFQEEAMKIENEVKRLFKCERHGVSGLVDSDYFRSYPMNAAIMVISYVYAKGLENDDKQFDEFFSKYQLDFNNSDEEDMETIVDDYIEDLKQIVDRYANK